MRRSSETPLRKHVAPQATISSEIPKGFHQSAQRWTTQSPYAGWTNQNEHNPERVESIGRNGEATACFFGRWPRVVRSSQTWADWFEPRWDSRSGAR